jgi:hypothetical protein
MLLPTPSFEGCTRYYARGAGPSQWLRVVVSYVVRYAPGTSRVVGLTVLGAREVLERDGHLAVTVPETVETTAE